MNALDLLDAIGMADDDMLQRAKSVRRPRRTIWMTVGASAACLCIAAGAAMTMAGKDINLKENSGENAFTYTDDALDNAALTEDCLINDGTDKTPEGENEMQVIVDTTFTSSELPTVSVEITAWEENGVRGVIARLVDTETFPVGTPVEIRFTENTCIETVGGAEESHEKRIPDAEMFPVGTVITARVCGTESTADDTVLFAEAVSLDIAYGKDEME